MFAVLRLAVQDELCEDIEFIIYGLKIVLDHKGDFVELRGMIFIEGPRLRHCSDIRGRLFVWLFYTSRGGNVKGGEGSLHFAKRSNFVVVPNMPRDTCAAACAN